MAKRETMASRTPHEESQPEWTFEAALDRLGEIVDQLDGDAPELDQSLALFEEGVRLLRFAETALESADARIRQLLAEGDGFRLDEFSGEL